MINKKIVLNLFDHKFFNLKFNWLNIFIYLFFFTYGFYSLLTPIYTDLKSVFIFIFISITLIGFQIIYIFKLKKNYDKYNFKYLIKIKDVVIFFCIFSFIGFLPNNFLFESLYIDELAYVKNSLTHGIFILEILSNKFDLNNYKFTNLLQIINLIIICAILFFFYYVNKLSFLKKYFIIILIFSLLRICVFIFSGNYSPHPPLQYLPILLFSSFFGLSDIVIKCSILTISSIFLFVLFKIIKNNNSLLISILLIISIFTNPLVFFLSTSSLHYTYGFFATTLILILLHCKNEKSHDMLVLIICLFALFRLPVFFLILYPAILTLKKEIFQIKGNQLFRVLFDKYFLATAVIPFFLFAIIMGHPATDGGNLLDNFDKLYYSKIIPISAYKHIPSIFIFTFFICFIYFFLKKKLIENLLVLFFFICIFYSIRIGLWGMPYYQAEYLLPFSILGLIVMIDYISKPLKILFMVLTILINIFYIVNISNYNDDADIIMTNLDEYRFDINKQFSFLTSFPHSYKEAFSYLKKNDLESQTLHIGHSYGLMPEIINNYKISDLKKLQKYYDEHIELINFHDSFEGILINKDINFILVGSHQDKFKIIEYLKQNNWNIKKEFKHDTYLSSIILLKRKL